MIEVRRISEGGPLDFEVVVREGEGETRHHVTMSPEMCHRLTAGKHTPERCLEAAFRFLLDREPKVSRGPDGIVHSLCFATIRWPPPGYLENGVWRDGLCCARLMHFCAAILSASKSSLTALPQVYIDLTRL